MSQNDYTIANQGFPGFRTDLNQALQAIATNNSGATAPSTMFANMWWYDSSANILYIRNEDNDAWITFAELNQSADKFILRGTAQLDDGSASAPALTFNSDTNMGLYRGGADILKFVTAGTDAITINASQQVGIGGSPTRKFLVSGDRSIFESGDDNFAIGLKHGATGHGTMYIGATTGLSPDLQISAGTGAPLVNVTYAGLVGIGTTGSMDLGFGAQKLSVRTTDGTAPAIFGNAHASSGATVIAYHAGASFNTNLSDWRCARANNSAYNFAIYKSSSASDTEFYLRGDGNAYADGTWNGGGADYAEYFEWSDGNTESEDRRGYSVVLENNKIRKSTSDDDVSTIIGVVSGNPSVVGDVDMDDWKHKYQRDDYGTYIRDENGDRVLNSAYNSDQEYISRENRPEWDTIGLMGKLRIRKNQSTSSNWIKMRDVSDEVEEWLVR